MTADDLKNYIQYYEIMEKKKEQFVPINTHEEHGELVMNNEVAPDRNTPPDTVKEVASADLVDKAALQAINAFKF